MNTVRVRYGLLCFALMMVVTVLCLFPLTLTDSASADIADNYEITGGAPATYSSLADAFSYINSDSNTEFTITVKGDDSITSAFSLINSKNVTLTSSDGNIFKITVSSSVRHGSVSGNLTLKNIILDGNGTAGGIEVKSGGSLTMNNG
ncbi:MAG: hypothetical protein LBJ20_06510, partial [Candidatus Methanoplasma sp.]|nr:hypothetical protein [Candidatus Methanoplasma sp.]